MMIDQLTKERHYILYTIDKNDIIAEATSYLLLNNVWKLHGLPLSLTVTAESNGLSRGKGH